MRGHAPHGPNGRVRQRATIGPRDAARDGLWLPVRAHAVTSRLPHRADEKSARLPLVKTARTVSLPPHRTQTRRSTSKVRFSRGAPVDARARGVKLALEDSVPVRERQDVRATCSAAPVMVSVAVVKAGTRGPSSFRTDAVTAAKSSSAPDAPRARGPGAPPKPRRARACACACASRRPRSGRRSARRRCLLARAPRTARAMRDFPTPGGPMIVRSRPPFSSQRSSVRISCSRPTSSFTYTDREREAAGRRSPSLSPAWRRSRGRSRSRRRPCSGPACHRRGCPTPDGWSA